MSRILPAATAVIACLLPLAAGCGGDDGDTLTIYSGREEEIVAPLLERFEQETGITLEVRYGDSAELAATIAEEGDNSPADAFFAQDAGSLGVLAEEGRLAELPPSTLARVEERFRDREGRWVGTSGRVRVIAYNTEAVRPGELPASIWRMTEPRWRGRLGIAPTNASFQAMVTAMRLSGGEARTRAWLVAVKRNRPHFYEKNTPILEALARGEIDAGLVNHYYLGLLKEEQPGAPVANHYLSPGDPGGLVNVAGVGILEGADGAESAERLVSFLLSKEGQRFYAEEAEEAEYPLIRGVRPAAGLPSLAAAGGPGFPLEALGGELERTLELLNETGFTS